MSRLAQPDPLWESTQMDDLDLKGKARLAIFHALGQIRSNATVGYELGIGTPTFALLTEAYAAMTGEAVDRVRRHFLCSSAARAPQADKERLDWLSERFLELPTAYAELIGLPPGQRDLREAVDAARERH